MTGISALLARHARRQAEAARAQEALIARADHQHAMVLSGNLAAGVYGLHPPVLP